MAFDPRSTPIARPLTAAFLLLSFASGPLSAAQAEPEPTPDTIPLPDLDPEGAPGTPEVADTLRVIPVEGVTVDILRSPMSLEAVPFAVSVLTDELYRSGRSGAWLEEALHGLPGVRVQNRFNAAVGERITIRGFGARSPFGVRGVKVIVDGIPATLPDGQSTLDHLDLGSLGRVEALRGPGSALYGNAAGGVLIFESRTPPESTIRQELHGVDGEHGLRRRQATTLGTAAGIGYLLSLTRHEFEGFRATSEEGADPGAPSPAGVASGPAYGRTLRDQLNAQLSAPFLSGVLRLTVNALDLAAEDPGALTREHMEREERITLPLYVDQRAGQTVRQAQAGIGWDGPVRDRNLDLMAYLIARESRSLGPFAILDVDRRVMGLRGIVRSEHVGEVGRAWWAIGAESDLQLDDRRHFLNAAGERGLALIDQGETVLGSAVFLQAMLPINPIVNVLTGLRYDRIRFSASDRIGGRTDLPDMSGARTLDSASPSFGVHAGFHSALHTYLNLSTAFETPTSTELAVHPDGTAGFNPELEPQVGFTIEVGARGTIAQRIAYEAAYFHTTLHGELLPFESDERPGLNWFQNAGRSIREGFEMALQFSPSRYGNVRLTHAMNRATFRELEVEDESHRGNRVPGLAPWTTEGLVRIGPGSWFAEYRAELNAQVPGNHANDPEASSPSYRLHDVRVGVNELNLLWLRLSAFAGITNLTDAYYNTSIVVNAAAGRYFEPGPGRSVYFGGSAAVQR